MGADTAPTAAETSPLLGSEAQAGTHANGTFQDPENGAAGEGDAAPANGATNGAASGATNGASEDTAEAEHRGIPEMAAKMAALLPAVGIGVLHVLSVLYIHANNPLARSSSVRWTVCWSSPSTPRSGVTSTR